MPLKAGVCHTAGGCVALITGRLLAACARRDSQGQESGSAQAGMPGAVHQSLPAKLPSL